ncbi:MAG: Ig-like domain-containing protein, partial [Tannerella sp.]|nr:Ig-like domain-containing protein [Tannerella sp.]
MNIKNNQTASSRRTLNSRVRRADLPCSGRAGNIRSTSVPKRVSVLAAALLALCLLLANSSLLAQTTEGTDFWLAFGQQRDFLANRIGYVDMQLRIVTTNATTVTLTYTTGLTQTFTIAGNTVFSKSFSSGEKLRLYSTGESATITKNSLHITSSQPVSVYALISASAVTDATNVLPTDALGNDYYHISFRPGEDNFSNTRDAMTVVATEDNTRLYIDDIYTRLMNKGEVYYKPSATEMTGSHVTSDKPVAHFVTHRGAFIPDNRRGNADNLYQQMVPVHSWGTKFLVPDIGRDAQRPLQIRVVAAMDGTDVRASGVAFSTPMPLKKGEFVTLTGYTSAGGVLTRGCYITSNKPVGVCTYLLSYSTTSRRSYGGPAAVWIPPVEQRVTSTSVAPFIPGSNTQLTEHFAIIVTPAATKGQTRVNNAALPGTWKDRSEYSCIEYTLPVDNTTTPYTFSNPNGLTVLVCGLGPSESYYYLAGSSLYNLNMTFSVGGYPYREIQGKTFCGGNMRFVAKVEYAKSPLDLKWYVNGVEETAARNRLNWNKPLPAGHHDVRMTVVDVNGRNQTIATDFYVESPTLTITGPAVIAPGEKTSLSSTIRGTWRSNNAAVATVSSDGTVTGVAPGETTFTFISTAGCSTVTGAVKVVARATAAMINVSGKTENICHGTATVLTATAPGVSSPVFRWYASQTATDTLHTGGIFATPPLTAQAAYYVTVSGNNYGENGPGNRREITLRLMASGTRDFYVDGIHHLAVKDTVMSVGASVHFRADLQTAVPATLKWYVDGVEETAAENVKEWSRALASGRHTVTMEVTDECGTNPVTADFTAVGASTMRWTGLDGTDWHNPDNWVEVVTARGRQYEMPVSWWPMERTNAVIPSGVPHYPELDAPASCDTVTVQDRAMLKNPHALTYTAARVEMKLKASERDRAVMWSAPLADMYSGDYHFKNAAGQPLWGDVRMSYFRRDGSAASGQTGISAATVSTPDRPLELGRAFNLQVTSTSVSRDRTWQFPQPDAFYTDAAGKRYPATGSLPRAGSRRFVTDGAVLDASGRFDLPVFGRQPGGSSLVQVVNPYLAYLRMDSFLLNNRDSLAGGGYLIWNGDPNSSFIAVKFAETDGRIIATSPSLAASDAALIPPLQSFFIAKKAGADTVTSVFMSPRWTTTSVPNGAGGGYTLRSAGAAAENGLLRIRASQGNSTGYAVLYYEPEASPEYDGDEDVQSLLYDENPLAVYVLTTRGTPLAICADGEFGSHATGLGLRIAGAGEVTLEFSGQERFGHNVYLIDRECDNLQIDLRQTPVYTFTPAGTPATLDRRFLFRMDYTGLGLVSAEEDFRPEVQFSGRDGHIHVRSQTGMIRQIQVYNLPGMRIYSSGTASDRFAVP